MSGTTLAIVSGTVLLIGLYLILTINNGQAFNNVFGSIGSNYVNAIKALQGKG